MNEAFEGSEISVILVVKDLASSRKFYKDQLGGELYREYGGTTLVCKVFGMWIILVTEGEPTPDKPGISFRPPADLSKTDHSFTIRVKSCQNAYENLMTKGVAFITPPYRYDHEVRCFFRDPDGHLFEISEITQL